MALSPGSRLGPYEIVAPLGAGGMGEVYRARDTRLSRHVAIKVLPSDLASDASRLRRFETEALAASSLSHPNIVTIYEFGRENGTSFLAMELVEGKDLRSLLSAGPIPVKRLLEVASQVADGLAKAHASGIVHRDLKPASKESDPRGTRQATTEPCRGWRLIEVDPGRLPAGATPRAQDGGGRASRAMRRASGAAPRRG